MFYSKFRPVFLLSLVLLLIAGAGLALYAWLQPAPPPSTVTLTRGNIRATVNANARVQAARTARLAFPVSGLIARVLVQEGDTVKAGDALAELKPDEFDRRVRQYELALQSRQLDLARAQAAPRKEDLDIARASLKKAALALSLAEDTAKKNPSTSNNAARDAAQADYDIAQANLDRLTRGPTAQEVQAYQLAVANAQIDLDNARAARDQTVLLAPYDGVVTDVNAQPGELIGGYTPLIGMADTSRLELLADIDEIDIGSVAAGQNVEIHLDAFPGQTTIGKVAQVFPAASSERGAMVYRARISLDPGLPGMRPGMGATIRIATVEKEGVWLLPSRAIKNAGAQKIVTGLIAGARRDLVVQTGLSDGSQTEILSGIDPEIPVIVE
ncbi:MAG: efflux RND transporter periplasmic adaptor subunit [Anaerolineae bacterium]